MGKREQQPDRKRFAGSVLLRWIAMAVCVIVMICCGVYLVRLAVESHTIKEETQGAAEQYVQPIPSADTTDPAAESSSEEGIGYNSRYFFCLGVWNVQLPFT